MIAAARSYFPPLVWEGPRPVSVIYLDPATVLTPAPAFNALNTRPPLWRGVGLFLLFAAGFVVGQLHGQVAPTVTIAHGEAVTQVGNPSREPQTVTVAVWQSLRDTVSPSVLVSPLRFTLAPGELQVVRIRARVACDPAWRWTVLFSPVETPDAARVRLNLLTRIVAKVQCLPQ